MNHEQLKKELEDLMLKHEVRPRTRSERFHSALSQSEHMLWHHLQNVIESLEGIIEYNKIEK